MEDLDNWQEKFEECIYAKKLLDKVTSLNKIVQTPPIDIEEVKKAIYYARKYHGTQMRQSGEPYYSHPIEVAYMVAKYNLKTDVIIASILHDIVEDTAVTTGMVLDIFGWRVAEMVDRLTRKKIDGSILSVEDILNHAYCKHDAEVVLIKLMDRLHNMMTIQFKSQESQKRIALDTWNNFLVASASINLNFEKELHFLIYNVLNLPQGINSITELYILSEIREKSVLFPLTFENGMMQI